MHSFIRIQMGLQTRLQTRLRYAVRFAQRLMALHAEALFDAMFPALACRQLIPLRVTQHHPLHTNPSEPLMAPARPRSHGASARHFL